MKKMKRIEAIIKGRKFEKLLGLRKRQIYRAVEAAADNAEKQKEDAAIAYENMFARLGDDGACYEDVFNEMLAYKQAILSADITIKAVAEIRADLDAEVEVDEAQA